MAYEQRPKGKVASSTGISTVRIEKSGDLGLVNAQLLNYRNLGYEVKEGDYAYTATISVDRRKEIEAENQQRGISQVLGTRTISAEDRSEGMNLSTVETLAPIKGEELLSALAGE